MRNTDFAEMEQWKVTWFSSFDFLPKKFHPCPRMESLKRQCKQSHAIIYQQHDSFDGNLVNIHVSIIWAVSLQCIPEILYRGLSQAYVGCYCAVGADHFQRCLCKIGHTMSIYLAQTRKSDKFPWKLPSSHFCQQPLTSPFSFCIALIGILFASSGSQLIEFMKKLDRVSAFSSEFILEKLAKKFPTFNGKLLPVIWQLCKKNLKIRKQGWRQH